MVLHLFLRQFVKKLHYKIGEHVNEGELCKLDYKKFSPKLAQRQQSWKCLKYAYKHKSIKKPWTSKKIPVHYMNDGAGILEEKDAISCEHFRPWIKPYISTIIRLQN